MSQPVDSGGMVVYNDVTVETETETYEGVLAIHGGNVLGIVPDPAELEREYGGAAGPGPEILFKRHARHVVPWRRVVHIDRGPTTAVPSDTDAGRRADTEPHPDHDDAADSGGATDDRDTTKGDDGDATDEGDAVEEDDDTPDNVFDEV